jgi:hypothetical protein
MCENFRERDMSIASANSRPELLVCQLELVRYLEQDCFVRSHARSAKSRGIEFRLWSASLALFSCWLFQGWPAIAQAQQPGANPGTTSDQRITIRAPDSSDQSQESTAPDKFTAKQKEEKEKRGSIVAAPLPISSPAIGSGIIPVLRYIFPFGMKDKISPPSVVGAAGLITNNGSRGFAVGAQLYLKEDRYRITGGYVHGNIDYNIYGTGVASDLKLPLIQTSDAYFGGILRRVWHQFFVGPRFFRRRVAYYA